MNREIQLEVWGDLACFTRPEMKVERMTYDVPTPSAVRGILSAIYSHPSSFYWQVNRIEVLHPIRYLRFIRNEVSRKTGRIPFSVSESGNRVQRLTVALRDVRYRVAASIIRREGCPISETALYEQARRRIAGGKCYYQPSLGCREFTAYFEESDGNCPPIPVDQDLGLMVYDVFDIREYHPTGQPVPYISLYHACMEQGVILVPPYDSTAVLKPEENALC